MKYLEKNEIKENFTKKQKVSLQEIKEDLNKWTFLPCPR